MKRSFILLSVVLSAALASCTEDRIVPESTQESYNIDIFATLQEDSATKMAFQESLDGQNHPYLQSSWTESDAINITSNANYTFKAVTFNLVEGQGTGNGHFRSSEAVAASSKSWTVFYPASVKTTNDYNNFSFDGQTQNGNDNKDHLSAYNLFRKVISTTTPQPLPENIDFSGDDFDQSACIKFVLSNFPEAITPQSLKMEIYGYGRTLVYNDYSIKVEVNSNYTQTLSLTGIQEVNSLTAYMMIPPSNLTIPKDYYLRLTLSGDEGKKFVAERKMTSEAVLQKGKYNIINIKKNWLNDNGIDGTWGTFQTPTAPDIVTPYCNFIIMGDGYTAEDYEGENSKFMQDARTAYEALFSQEPYKSLKEYFGAYYVNVVSPQKINTKGKYLNGADNVDTHTTLETLFTKNSTATSGNNARAYVYASKIEALNRQQVSRASICVISNKACHAGTCTIQYLSEVSDYCPLFSVAFLGIGNEGPGQTTDFTCCVIHEVGGHGFGKLGDEYGSGYYKDPSSMQNSLRLMHSYGLYKNVDVFSADTTTILKTPWAYLDTIPAYAPEKIGVYEGAYVVARDFCRSTENSLMRDAMGANNSDYFNAISRRRIYHRAMRLIGKTEQEANDGFIAWDTAHLPQTGPYAATKTGIIDNPGAGLLPLAEPILVPLN